MSIRSLFALLLISLLSFPRAFAQNTATTASMGDFTTTIDKDRNLHIVAAAQVTAPEAKVFEAISRPDLVAKSDPQVDKVQIISQQGNSRTIEVFGPQFAIPNAPESLKIKVTTDARDQIVNVESCPGTPLQFQNEYKISPSQDGQNTIVNYSSVSNDIGKQLGTAIPDEMRKEIGLQVFMHQMHRVGRYIDEHSSVANN